MSPAVVIVMNGLLSVLLSPSSLLPRHLAMKEWVAPEFISVNNFRLERERELMWYSPRQLSLYVSLVKIVNSSIQASTGCGLYCHSWHALAVARNMAFFPTVAATGGPKAVLSKVSLVALRAIWNECHSILGIFLTGCPSPFHISCFKLLMSPLTLPSFIYILKSWSRVVAAEILLLRIEAVVLSEVPWTEQWLSSFSKIALCPSV